MKIFSEKNKFEKDLYTVIGVNFKEPIMKRKTYKTEKSFGECSFFLELFTSARHRMTIEVEVPIYEFMLIYSGKSYS